MKIVDFREKTEALGTVRKPPFRELSTKLGTTVLVRLRRHMDAARFTSCLSCWILSILDTPLCSAPGGALAVRPQPRV